MFTYFVNWPFVRHSFVSIITLADFDNVVAQIRQMADVQDFSGRLNLYMLLQNRILNKDKI